MMGASSSSSNGIRPPTPISTSECAAETFSYSKDARPVNDRRQKSYIYAKEDQPRLQDPSPYASALRTDEFCDQRSTAPSLSNVSPKRETLLAYATQMTGWQPAESRDSSVLQHNSEVMELSRIISQLAMANHQLASAHNIALARMEALYLELSKDKEDRKRRISTEALEICDDILRKKLRDAEGSEEARKLEQRVVRLERMLATSSVGQCKQKGEEDNKPRSKIERFENSSKIRDTRNNRSRSAESCCESSQQRTMGHIAIDVVSEVPDDRGEDAREGTGVHRCAHSDDSESNVPRIDENSCSASVDLDKTCRRRARLRDSEQDAATENLASEEMLRLSREIRRLEADRLECQSANKQLLCNLAEQEDLLGKLSADYEELKSRYATVEANLHEHRQQHDNLTKHLDIAKKEIERLLKEIEVFQSEKDTADARISTLEQELQKTLLEKEQIRNAESQKASKLRAQLSEEVSDKKKQIKALEDALQEIQRLKETVKTERRSENGVAPKEDIDAIDSTDDVSENADRTATNMEEFKKELSLKREARHRAIAAVSSEMERLRRELDAEKEAHSETSSMLALLRSACSDSQDLDLASRGDPKSTTRRQEAREHADENESELRRADALRLTNMLKVSDELRNDVRYQIEKVDDLRYHLETDPERHRRRIQCLAEVSSKSRESLVARERRTNELKNYLAQVLVRLGDRSFLDVQDDTGAECDRQLENINALKALYNERLRVLTELKDSAIKELTDVRQKLEYTLKKSENLEEELKKAEEKVDAQDSEITNLESQLGLTKADCRDLQNQMSLINGLFTQMLLGASSADMDLDRLTQLLQENHDLISDIAREESTEAAALPKLLLDLVEQVEGGKASQKHASEENGSEENVGEIDRKEDDLQEENIAHNLPKVWRVLLELLSCHAVTSPSVSVASCSDPNSCYKSVDTPAGPRLVISVSKTYIRLKELILEKKHLEKEMNRMKQLNTHLESKLGEQEKRLSMVSAELAKTWNIVGRMQAQHQQLHTHEEILRYELQQKRKMLQELKQELEYCREKWESARQKNTNTELEWRSLRREFAARKALAAHDSFNSAESGFSDERGDDSDEEEEAIEGRIRHGLRRRTRKESPRAPTPDTESEQPTDTELSESKTGSSVTLEQRTPTPETEAELDEAEAARVDSEPAVSEPAPNVENTPETLDPLDQALTNVIQNLLEIDHAKSGGSGSILREDSTMEDPRNSTVEIEDDAEKNHATSSKMDFCNRNPRLWTPIAESWCSLPTAKTLKRSVTSVDLSSAVNNGESTESSNVASRTSSRHDDIDEVTKSESVPSSPVSHAPIAAADAGSATPVFSIGPLPTALIAPCSSIKSVQFSDPLIVGPSNRFSAPVFGAVATELDNSADNLVASTIQFSSKEKEGAVGDKEQGSSKPADSFIDSDSISVDSSSSLDTVREFPTADRSPTPLSTSVSEETATISPKEATVASAKSRTPEEVLATRADRLKRLEEQADWLMKKMNATSKRSDALCTRLEELHDVYGEPPVPPPMPDVLPSRRLPSSLPASPPQVSELMSAGGVENAEDESSHVVRNDASSSSAKEP